MNGRDVKFLSLVMPRMMTLMLGNCKLLHLKLIHLKNVLELMIRRDFLDWMKPQELLSLN